MDAGFGMSAPAPEAWELRTLIEDKARANPSMAMAARISGALIGPVALVFMMYALYIYRQRTFQILRRETVRYDDQRGPVMLVLALVAVCSVAYGLGLSMIFLDRPTPVAAAA